jgi:predicted esterase YcpF (UPF0227 family)
MVIYIHGFGGSGKGFKAGQLKEYYTSKGVNFLAPSLSYVPQLAISTLEDIITACSKEDIKLIGSSLGGFYAIYLANKFNLKAVLINPSTKPNATLQRILKEGKATNFFDLSTYEFNLNHLYMLKNYQVSKPNESLYMLMLQKDDDVIDYTIAKEQFSNAKQIITTGGGHGFEGLQNYFKDIDSFLNITHLA